MTHFGLLCPATTGHLNTMLPLGQELQRRGHRVTLFGVLDVQARVLAAGLDFWAIGIAEFPLGAMECFWTQLAKLRGLAAFEYTLKFRQQIWAAVLLRDALGAVKAAGVDALLIDQVVSGSGAIAEILEIPFITICSALPMNQEDGVPPFFTAWNYHPTFWACLRNRAGYSLLERYRRMVHQAVDEYRRAWKLTPYQHLDDSFSKLAQLSQQPAEFEFPRQHLPAWFHFTGPYHNLASRGSLSFPFEKLTDQPLVYASMGTLRNRSQKVFWQIAEACQGLKVQLVISLGGGCSPESLPDLPGNPVVVSYAPQLELLQKATLTITHAGLNTTLESLRAGVPMVAIPITDDQPGVGARLQWTGAGEVVPKNHLSVPRLRTAIERVLNDESYRQHAIRLQAAIARSGGVIQAANIVEQAIATGKPVFTSHQTEPNHAFNH